MTTYEPDIWVPLLIESERYGKIYKVLAGWYGGFAGASNWRLSSGIESITVSDDGSFLTIPQSTGSVYIVPAWTQMSSMLSNVFTGIVESSEEQKTFTVKLLELDELLAAFCNAK